MRNVHSYLLKVMSIVLSATMILPAFLLNVATASAATVTGFTAQTNADGTASVTWSGASGVGSYDVAASRPALDGTYKYCAGVQFGWFSGLASPKVSLQKLPTDGSELCLRVFPNGGTPATDYFFSAYKGGATQVSTPTPTTTVPAPTTNPVDQTPATTPAPTTPPANITPVAGGNLSAIWANDGGDKVTRDEHRATNNATSVVNSVWDGSKIKIFGGKNEVVDFNAVLEANTSGAKNVSVSFDTLTGPNGSVIKSAPATGNGVFDWTNRDIELFYIRYLPIKGLSLLSYETYDERHIPKRFQRPWTGEGIGSGSWLDRPDHDKYYPEIAVPLELQPTFNINANQNQSIWADIYIPKTATPGIYTGTVTVKENGSVTKQIPVELTVRNFTLPDTPTAKTMVDYTISDLNQRILGSSYTYPNAGTSQANISNTVQNRLFQLAHRHKISLIDDGLNGENPSLDQPSQIWLPRLNGNLFTSANGYRGPGEGVGNNVYSIGTYSGWGWKNGTQADMQKHADNWMNWFNANSPNTETFLYLLDESSDYTSMQKWSQWIDSDPGPGKKLKTFATIPLPTAAANTPALDIAASWMTVGNTNSWQTAVNNWKASGKQFMLYNGKRPSNGTFATEDDGVALRELAWAQYKKGIDRWFFWNGTYYNDYQSGRGQTNVFQNAQTFGGAPTNNSTLGETSWNHSNGDGVLFYPGTDQLFPADSYGVQGVFASVRLKEWRRGIQDVDYLTLAAKINPTKTQEIINRMVPKAFWDYGVSDPNDPSWVRTNISWSIDPNDWEKARAELAGIIDGITDTSSSSSSTGSVTVTPAPTPTPTPSSGSGSTSTDTQTPNPSTGTSTTSDASKALSLHLDELSGATTFVDASGKGNKGTCSGTTCPLTMSGKLNGGFKFDGKDDRIVVADSNSLDLTKNFTIDTWVYPTASGSYKTVLGKRGAYYLALNYSKPAVWLSGLNKPGWYLGTKALPLNAWSRVTITFDGANLKIYMNGNLDRTISGLTGAVNNSSNPLWIGMRDDYVSGSSYRFTGGLDEFVFYNRVLSDVEIKG